MNRSDDSDDAIVRLAREAGGDGMAAAFARGLATSPLMPGGARSSRLLARAKAAIGAAPPSVASLVVRAIGGIIEVLAGEHRLGEVVAPLPVRGETRGGVLVRQPLGNREIVAHVDVRDGRFMVMLDLGRDAPARGTRVTLRRGDREVASEILRQGRVLLPEMGEGAWRIEVRDSGGWLGELDLLLTRHAA